jgi:hypothetical protein
MAIARNTPNAGDAIACGELNDLHWITLCGQKANHGIDLPGAAAGSISGGNSNEAQAASYWSVL